MSNDIGHGQGVYSPEETQLTCEELLAGSHEQVGWYMDYCHKLEEVVRSYRDIAVRSTGGFFERLKANNDLKSDGGKMADEVLAWPINQNKEEL